LKNLAVLFGFQGFAQEPLTHARIIGGRFLASQWLGWSHLLLDILRDLLDFSGIGTPAAILIALDSVGAVRWKVCVFLQQGLSPRAADALPEFAVRFALRSFAQDGLPPTAVSGGLWRSLGRWSCFLSRLLEHILSDPLNFSRLRTPA